MIQTELNLLIKIFIFVLRILKMEVGSIGINSSKGKENAIVVLSS